MSCAPFTVPETRLAEALGVARKSLKSVRAERLEQPADWDYAPGGAVHYTRKGVELALLVLSIPAEKIALLLPPPAAPAPAPLAPPAAPAAQVNLEQCASDDHPDYPLPFTPAPPEPPLALEDPGVVNVTVTRCYTVNHRIVAGHINQEPVRVRVRSSAKLRPGMVLRCALVEADLYELAERLPRWAGKR